MSNVKKENGVYENGTQDESNAYQVSLDRDFQMLLLELMGAIKIAIDNNKSAIDKNKEAIDSSSSDLTYLVERGETNEQEMNEVKQCVFNNRTMLITNSQTLQIMSNNISGNSFNNPQQGMNSTFGNNNNMDFSGQIAALRNQQQQLQNKQPNKFGLPASLDLTNKYGLNGSNIQQKRSYERRNNSGMSRYNNSDIMGQRQQNSYNTNLRNNIPSSIESKLQERLGTDPKEHELLKEQQRAKSKMQPSSKVRPMIRERILQSKDREVVNNEVQDITISDSEDEEKETENKKLKQDENEKGTLPKDGDLKDKSNEKEDHDSDNEEDKAERFKPVSTQSSYSPTKSTLPLKNSLKDKNDEDDDDNEGSKIRDLPNTNAIVNKKANINKEEDDEEEEEKEVVERNKIGSKHFGLTLPSQFNLSKYGLRDEKESEKYGDSSFSALKSKLNLQRYGNDDEMERREAGRYGALGINSSLRSSLGKYNLPTRFGNNEDEERSGGGSSLGIGADLRNRYKLTNFDSNAQNSSLGRFMENRKFTPSSLSSNLFQDTLLDKMRSSSNLLTRDNDRISERRDHREQWNRDIPERKERRENTNGRDNDSRENRDRHNNLKENAPENSDNERRESMADTNEKGNASEEEKEERGDELPMQ